MPLFTTLFHGYSVKFSPFHPNLLAVATAQNFGILDNGRLHVVSLFGRAGPALITSPFSFDIAEGIYDLAWSKSHNSLLIAAIGSFKLLDTSLPATANPETKGTKWTTEEMCQVGTKFNGVPERRAKWMLHRFLSTDSINDR